jgi:hypothetical protein
MPLPLHIKPAERETLCSVMSRMATVNGLNVTEFCTDVGTSLAAILEGKPEAIAACADITGANPDKLSRWSPRRHERGNYHFNTHLLPSKTLRDPEIRGCPYCLRADAAMGTSAPHRHMALRGHWLVKHVTVCLIHDQPLVPLWRRKKPSERYDTAARFREIASAILAGDFDAPHREATHFDEWLDARLEKGADEIWLGQQPLHAAATFCRLLGYALLRHEDFAPSNVDMEEEAWSLCEMGYQVAKKGEAAVRERLRTLQELPGGPHDGPKKIFPRLYDRLAHDYRDDPRFAAFRKVLRDHMLDTWPLARGDDLLGEPVLERRLHSVKSAAEMTGIDQRRLRRMLNAASLIPEAQADRADAWCVFDAAAAAPFLDQAVTLLDAKAFAATMGLSRSQFDLLVADGTLRPEIEDPQIKALWNPSKGRAWLEDLMTGAEPLREAHHGWCSVSKSAQRLKITPGPILQAILDRRLKRVARLAEKDGFAALYVHHDEVSALLGDEPSPAMSLETFAKSVGIGRPAFLRRLVVNGHMPTTKLPNPRTKAMQGYVTEADAAAFHARFFTLRTASLHFDQSWQILSAKLREHGILSFSPDGEDYGTLWLRSEVEAALD